MKPKGSQFTWLRQSEDSGAGEESVTYYMAEKDRVPEYFTELDGDDYEEIGGVHGTVNFIVTEEDRSDMSTFNRYATGRGRLDPAVDYSSRQEYKYKYTDKAGVEQTGSKSSIQQKLFEGGHVTPAHVDLLTAGFTKETARQGFSQAMGMMKNEVGDTPIRASSSLSRHSGPLVNRMAEAGLVQPMGGEWTEEKANGLDWPPKRASVLRVGNTDIVPEEDVRAGSDTTRKMMGQLRKSRQRPMKGEQRLFE